LLRTGAGSRQNAVLMPARVGHPQDTETGGRPYRGVRSRDVHYLSTGEAGRQPCWPPMPPSRTCWPTTPAMVPQAPAYWPGQFCRRELGPLRVVLGDLSGLGLLVVGGYADLDPSGSPAGARRRTPSSASGDRGGQAQVPHGDPRGAGLARILAAPVPSGDDRDAASVAGLTDSPSRLVRR
jgi:hypothetical protein